MKNNLLKKIFYCLGNDVPWYELANDKNNEKKQIKLETKILNLMTAKNFKITDSNYVQETSSPIFSLPTFMQINWPNGTDATYFKSYEVLKYFEDVGMIKFKLTLTHDTSKEYLIKGFNNWSDILMHCENDIEAKFKSAPVMDYLKSKEFACFLGQVNNAKLESLIAPLYENHFIKEKSIKINIVGIDYQNSCYSLQINWLVDPKYHYLLKIDSAFVTYLKEQINLLTQFVTSNETLIANIKKITLHKISDQQYLNNFWKVGLEDYLKANHFDKLELSIRDINEANCSIMVDFYDPYIKNDVTNIYVIDDLLNAKEIRAKIIKTLHTYEFNDKLASLYSNQQLNEQSALSLLKEFGFDENFALNWKEHNQLPQLMVEIKATNLSQCSATNFVSIPSLFAKFVNNYISTMQFSEILFADPTFQKILIDNYFAYSQLNVDCFSEIMQTYDAVWKQQVLEHPFKIMAKANLVDPITYLSNVNGIINSHEIYTISKQVAFSMTKYLDLLASDNEFTRMLYQQTYDELTSSEFDKKLKSFADNLIIKHNQLSWENSNYHLHLDYTSPFQVFNLVVSDNEHHQANKYLTNKYSHNYAGLTSVSGNPGFYNKLCEIAQEWFDNPKQEIDAQLINNLIASYVEGVYFDNIIYQKQLETDENTNEPIIIFKIMFKVLFPTMEFKIAKIAKQVDLPSLANLFSEQVANYLSTQTDHVNEYKVSDLIAKFNNSEFNALNKDDAIITISEWNSDHNPMILYAINIPSLNIDISDYTFNYQMVKDAWALINKFNDELINKIKQTLPTNQLVKFKQNQMLFNPGLDLTNKPLWWKNDRLGFKLNDHSLNIYYGSLLIQTY